VPSCDHIATERVPTQGHHWPGARNAGASPALTLGSAAGLVSPSLEFHLQLGSKLVLGVQSNPGLIVSSGLAGPCEDIRTPVFVEPSQAFHAVEA